MTGFCWPHRWARAAALCAALSAGSSLLNTDPVVGDEIRAQSPGYCALDSCSACEDESWWDRFRGFCHERSDDYRNFRRRMYWHYQGQHKHLMYPESSPFCSPTYGYYQTCWRPFPYECPRCPQYVTSPASSPPSIPPGSPPMELAPATDAAQPGLAPGPKEPYFPQPAVPPKSGAPAPPASEPAVPPAAPEMFEGDADAALPLGFRSLPPVQEVFSNDGWMPHGLRPVRTASYGFVSED